MRNLFETMPCPVPILQEEWEFSSLLGIYCRKAPWTVVEIGSFYGGTLYYWASAREKGPNTLISVDLPIGPADDRYEEMIKSRQLWRRWVGSGKVGAFYDLQGDSHAAEMVSQVQEIVSGSGIDFLYIDGDHSFNGVKSDFENYAPMVNAGGLIVLHDVYGLPEVAQYWQELKKTHRTTEIVGQPGGWGIGIIEKQ